MLWFCLSNRGIKRAPVPYQPASPAQDPRVLGKDWTGVLGWHRGVSPPFDSCACSDNVYSLIWGSTVEEEKKSVSYMIEVDPNML